MESTGILAARRGSRRGRDGRCGHAGCPCELQESPSIPSLSHRVRVSRSAPTTPETIYRALDFMDAGMPLD
ncbi:hypothetical protein MAHJHV54_47850 [Mycobacterium avium subsp. hominissuis]